MNKTKWVYGELPPVAKGVAMYSEVVKIYLVGGRVISGYYAHYGVTKKGEVAKRRHCYSRKGWYTKDGKWFDGQEVVGWCYEKDYTEI